MSDNQEKRFFWLKLKVNFMTSETVDFLMSQKDGANYIVLYQMLCLKTINTDGRLSRTIGEIIIPFDENKIQRDCKWFSIDTIRVAMELYKKLGLIYEDTDGTLVITDHQGLIGSECSSAERVRKLRNSRQLLEPKKEDEVLHCNTDCNAQCNAQCNTDCNENVTTEIEYRDRDIEIELRDKNKRNNKGLYNTDAEEDNNETLTVNVQAAASENDPNLVCTAVGKAWNKTGFTKVRSFPVASQRGKAIYRLVGQYGLETVLSAIEKTKQSEFLRELGDRVTLDWFLQAEHFQKVLEGQYDRKWERRSGETKGTSSADRIRAMIERGDFKE